MRPQNLANSASVSVQPERRAKPRRPFRKTRRPDERIFMLGAAVDLVRPEEVLFHLSGAVRDKQRFIIANHNLHSFYLHKKEPQYREFFAKANLIELDSRPLVLFARALGLPGRPFHRCTYLDWRDLFWRIADREGWRIFYLGGTPGVADAAARKLASDHPGVTLATHHGYFAAEQGATENNEVLQAIADFQPDVLFVGMGMPRQELWILQNLTDLPSCPVLSVGAAFDYEAGVQKAAPRWVGQIGLEWLFRLLHDPRRLFRRYCIEPWSLLDLAFIDIAAALRRPRRAASGRSGRAPVSARRAP